MTRAHRSSPFLLAFVFLLALTGCERCGKTASAPGSASELTRQLPRDVEAVLVVPDVGVLGQRLALLERLKIASFLAQLQGLSSAKAWSDLFVAQLGVDIRSPEALKKAGLAPERGVAVVLLPSGDFYSVIGVSDAKSWEQTVATLAKVRLGAGVRAESTVNGRKVVSFSRAEGTPPLLGMVMLDGYVLMSAKASAPKVAQFVVGKDTPTLADQSLLKDALGRLEGDKDAWAYLPPGSGLGRRYTLAGALVSLQLSPQAFSLRADLAWPHNQSALNVLESKADESKLTARLPSNVFAAVRYGGDPSLLGAWLPQLVGPRVLKAAREAGFDLQTELLDNLKPGMVMGVALSPAPPLGAGMPQLDLRRTNPFRYVHLTGFAQVKDPAQAQSTLEKVPKLAKGFGARLTPEERGGQKVYVTSYAQGEGVHVALKGDTVVMGSPMPTLEAALAGEKTGGLKAPLNEALDGRPVSVVLDLHQLANSVRNLPDEAWGIGGSLMKAPVIRWLEATDDLRAITATAWAKEKSIQGELSLRLVTK